MCRAPCVIKKPGNDLLSHPAPKRFAAVPSAKQGVDSRVGRARWFRRLRMCPGTHGSVTPDRAVPACVLPVPASSKPTHLAYAQRGTSALQHIFRDHFGRFAAEYDSRYASELGKFRIECISRVAIRLLTCGDYRQGVARIRCANPGCRHEYFRPFSCKGFFLCPSCSQKRTLLFSKYLDEQLLLALPHRQFFFTPWSGPRAHRGHHGSFRSTEDSAPLRQDRQASARPRAQLPELTPLVGPCPPGPRRYLHSADPARLESSTGAAAARSASPDPRPRQLRTRGVWRQHAHPGGTPPTVN